jgi:hypothetical protein
VRLGKTEVGNAIRVVIHSLLPFIQTIFEARTRGGQMVSTMYIYMSRSPAGVL